MTISQKFERLATDNAPGQEVRHAAEAGFLVGEVLSGEPVDFSHWDVNAHAPIPGAFNAYLDGFARGGAQAYTDYRDDATIREELAGRLGWKHALPPMRRSATIWWRGSARPRAYPSAFRVREVTCFRDFRSLCFLHWISCVRCACKLGSR